MIENRKTNNIYCTTQGFNRAGTWVNTDLKLEKREREREVGGEKEEGALTALEDASSVFGDNR